MPDIRTVDERLNRARAYQRSLALGAGIAAFVFASALLVAPLFEIALGRH